MHDPRRYNSASAADRRMLTGKSTPADQRAACNNLGIRYYRRRLSYPGGGWYEIDECTIYLDDRVYEMLRNAERQAECARWIAGRADIVAKRSIGR